MQHPRPWADGSEHTLLKNALEQVELSDRLGYDYVWATEHHFLEEYAHSSAPESFSRRLQPAHEESCASVTGSSRCRPYINHPARVAERIATLDLISDGRCDFGCGAGATETELGGFNVPQDREEGHVSGRNAHRDPHDGGRAVRRLREQVSQDAAAQRGAQASTETASAALDGVFAARIDSAGRAAGRRGADVFVRQSGSRPGSG